MNRCLSEDWFLLPFEIELQRAHIVALVDAGILTDDESVRIADALDEIESEYIGSDAPESDAEDLHTWVEHEVVVRVGQSGKKLHTARSRNDQVATLTKMFLIHVASEFIYDAYELTRVCCHQATAWADLTFPLQTHCQFAAPGSVGFWSLKYATAFQRSARTMYAMKSLWDEHCPLGSGAVAGSSIAIDRTIQAKGLDFHGPSRNALDSTSTRDEVLQYLGCITQFSIHLQSLATDVILFSQTPFGWTKYPPAFGTGSSMMPNKSNPDAMELLRGEACSLQSAHSELVLILKGLPSGYNRDLQCIKPLIRNTYDTVSVLSEMTSAFIEQLGFDESRIRESLSMGNIGATLRMESHVKEGKPLRDAHHAESQADGSAKDDFATDPSRYTTTGSASPDETRRIAKQILDSCP